MNTPAKEFKMQKRWYVIGSIDDAVSWSAKTDQAEYFLTKTAAVRRARAAAKDLPGEIFRVCETVAQLVAPVGPVRFVK